LQESFIAGLFFFESAKIAWVASGVLLAGIWAMRFPK